LSPLARDRADATSAEWTPSDNAWRHAASAAGNPSVSTAARIFTICRSPSSDPASLRRTRSSAVGSTPEAQVNLGVALQEAGEFDAATDCYRAAISAGPDTFSWIAQPFPRQERGSYGST
jgi:hypothetical protein